MPEANHTKEMLAETLRQLTHKKSFAKITIADITQASGHNRQTFYYHFRDKLELLQWIYEADAKAVFDDQLSFQNWEGYLAALLDVMLQNKVFYQNTISADEEVFKTYLFNWSKDIFLQAIEHLDDAHRLSMDDKAFYSEFFSFGLAGVVVSWVKQDMKASPQKVAKDMRGLVNNSERAAFAHYQNL